MTDLRGLLTDEDAVSPVIGVILMVAVTVVLSAAIGAFVLDIGNAVTEQQPNAVIEFEVDTGGSTDSVTLRHTGGDELATETLSVTIDGTVAWEAGSTPGNDFTTDPSGGWDDGVTSGDELVIKEDSGGDITASSSVELLWQDGQRSSILASNDS
jgi:flagellin-like protein